VKFFFVQLFLAFDQGLNTLLLGYADETLSARAWRAYAKGRIFGRIFKPLIDALFFWQSQPNDRGHCYNAYLKEKDRRNLPPEYRDSEPLDWPKI
jgi:hypothetical protein